VRKSRRESGKLVFSRGGERARGEGRGGRESWWVPSCMLAPHALRRLTTSCRLPRCWKLQCGSTGVPAPLHPLPFPPPLLPTRAHTHILLTTLASSRHSVHLMPGLLPPFRSALSIAHHRLTSADTHSLTLTHTLRHIPAPPA
jgi:hypothetical protein